MFCVDILRQNKPGLRRKVLAFVFLVSWLTSETTLVSCLNFTVSKLGTTGKLFMTCDVTETDASKVYNVQIRREASMGWETLAYIEAGANETLALGNDIVDDKDFSVGGILDTDIPLNTHLILEMNIEKLTYDDARVYRCEMTYKSSTGSSVSINRNATLLIIEADNKTKVRTDNTQQSSICNNGNSSVTVGAILGVTNILTVLYAAYLTAVIRRPLTRSFDDENLCHGRREPEHTATVAKQGLEVDQQTYSVNDDEDTYDLS